jgi:hypothetical protein
MSIKIRIPSDFSNLVNNKEIIEVNGHTIGECLRELFKQYSGFEKTIPSTGFVVYIDGERFFSWESDKPVKDGNELTISLLSGCC